MKHKLKHKPLGTITLVLSLIIFVIMFAVMTLQGALMYLYLKIWYQADIPMPQFWRPIPFIILVSALVGMALTILASLIPLRPIRDLIEAINQLAHGNFHVRVHLDLTQEFVRLSESFNSMAQELENTELLRSDFINNFSHEFKTPIVSLRGFAKLLKNPDLSQEDRDEYVYIIIHESTRLSQLAANVLNLSKIENMSILSDMERFDLTEEVRQSILLLESKWQKKELELIIDMDEVSYHGSRNLLNQVWINLIDNAVKFSPDRGKIKIKLHQDKGNTVFQIIDNGCGMSQDMRLHIFDRFYQGDPSHTTEGNGIGLTVVDKIVRLHKGYVAVGSEEGIGTTFTVTLPEIQPDFTPNAEKPCPI